MNIIYCYSGSGNCLDIAKNIAHHLGDTKIVMMRSMPVLTDATEAGRVGFIFPCYAGGLPGKVQEYIRQIKVSPDAYTFGIVSYAGYPGTGIADINSVIPLDYRAGISHHCSCIWLMPHDLMLPPLSVEKAQARSEKLAAEIAADILAGTKKTIPAANPLNQAEHKAWPLLQKKKSAKLQVSSDCVSCGQCVQLCPQQNIRIAKAIGKANIGPNCIGCLSCLQYCPTQAISMGGLTVKRERYHNPNITAAELSQDIIL